MPYKSAIGSMGALTLLSLSTLTIMVGAAIAPGLPLISLKLGLQNYSSWLITLPSLGGVIFGPIAGKLMQTLGTRNAVIMGLIAYGVLGGGGAFITSISLLFLDRFLLGAATVLVMAGGTQLISEIYSGNRRLNMIAYQGMAIEFGGVVFLGFGGILASLGWRAPFGLYLVAFALIAAIVMTIPKTAPTNVRNVTRGPKGELRQNAEAYIVAIGSMVVFFSAFITLPGALHDATFSEREIGFYLSGISLIAVLFAWYMPRLYRTLGPHYTLLIAFISYSVAHASLALGLGVWNLSLSALLLGAGFGLSIPLTNIMIIERSNEGERARNLAYLSSAIFLGQFLSSFLEVLGGEPRLTFLIATLIAFGAALMLFKLRPKPSSSQCTDALID